jgi:hypothetical protein
MPLTFDQMKTLVSANIRSSAFTNECVIAVCWKESSFDPNAQSDQSTARGLMQMTAGAINTVNNTTPQGIHYESDDMFDPTKAIQCGTYYLQWCFNQAGSKSAALDKYAGVAGYSTDVITAEGCLQSSVVIDPVAACLDPSHPFLEERARMKLRDDLSGGSRFQANDGQKRPTFKTKVLGANGVKDLSFPFGQFIALVCGQRTYYSGRIAGSPLINPNSILLLHLEDTNGTLLQEIPLGGLPISIRGFLEEPLELLIVKVLVDGNVIWEDGVSTVWEVEVGT